MPEHRLLRGSGEFKGLDRKTSTLQLPAEYSIEMKNAAYRETGAINKRKGYHINTVNTNEGSYGIFTYKKVNSSTGAVTDELLMVDDDLKTLVEGTFTITYSGSSQSWYSIKLDSSTLTFKFIITEGLLGEVLNYDIGTGLGHSSDKTLTQLKSAVDAVTNFSAAISGTLTGSEKAALMDTTVGYPIDSDAVNNAYPIPYRKWTAVTKGDSGLSATFPGYLRTAGNLNEADLENATFALLNDVVYIGNGYDEIMKYDGTRVYRAGLPKPISLAGADKGSGSGGPNGAYFYKMVYEYTDAQGNIITSEPFTTTSAVTVTDNTITVTYPNLQSGGWDLASSNLKIKLYRNKAGEGTTGTFYHITTVVNNTSGATSTFDDTVADAALVTDYIDHVKKHDPPPKGRYVTAFQGCLVIAGQRTNVNNIQYSMPFDLSTGEIGSEYFPSDDNGVVVESAFGDKITAIAPLREGLFIFHANSIHILTGDIAEPTGIPYRVDLLTREGGVGCESQASIQELDGNLVFLSAKGVYAINTSNTLMELSELVKALLLDTVSTKYKRKRAVGFMWVEENVYVIHVPTELDDTGSGGNPAIYTTGGIILAYDYSKKAWLKWDNIDYSGGVSLYKDKIFFNGRSKSSTSVVESELSSHSNSKTTYDFNDHASAVEFSYETNWESLKEPTIPKKFLRLKVYAMDVDGTFESPKFDLSIKVQRDFKYVDLGTITFQYGAENAAGWGGASWGTSGYGAAINQAVKTKMPTGKAKSMKLTFENSIINENILITNYEHEIVAPYRVEIKD